MQLVVFVLLSVCLFQAAGGTNRDLHTAANDKLQQLREHIGHLRKNMLTKASNLDNSLAHVEELRREMLLHGNMLASKQTLLTGERLVAFLRRHQLSSEKERLMARRHLISSTDAGLNRIEQLLGSAFTSHQLEERKASALKARNSEAEGHHEGNLDPRNILYSEFSGCLRSGIFLLKGKQIADDKHLRESLMLLRLYKDKSVSGVSLDEGQNFQVAGTFTDLSLNLVLIKHGSMNILSGAVLCDTGYVTGTYSSESGASGSFEYELKAVFSKNNAELLSKYLDPFPSDFRAVEKLAFNGTLQQGYYAAEGKTLNWLSNKELDLPFMLILCRSNGSLLGNVFRLKHTAQKQAVRLAGIWSETAVKFTFLFEGKIFTFDAHLIPSTNILGGSYHFGQSGKGRFALQLERITVTNQPRLKYK